MNTNFTAFYRLYPDDIEQLGDLFEANNRFEITNFFYPFPMLRETAAKLLDPSTKDLFFVANVDGKFVGMSMLRGFDEGFKTPSFGIFIDFYNQGKGYGRKLTEHTLAWADEHRIETVRLAVHEENKNALNLYRSVGFVKTEEKKDALERTLLVMQRRLK